MNPEVKEDIIEILGLRRSIESDSFRAFLLKELELRHGSFDRDEVVTFYTKYVRVILWIREHLIEYRIKETALDLDNLLSGYDVRKLMDYLNGAFEDLEQKTIEKLIRMEITLRAR